MKPNVVVEALGGRKNMLGYLFLLCSTYLVNAMLIGKNPPDYIGMSTIIGALAVGLASIVWGNVKEHQAKTEATTAINNTTEAPQ